MTWTKRKPTADGWYWWRRSRDHVAIILKLVGGSLGFPCCGETPGSLGGEWCGPLEPPATREE